MSRPRIPYVAKDRLFCWNICRLPAPVKIPSPSRISSPWEAVSTAAWIVALGAAFLLLAVLKLFTPNYLCAGPRPFGRINAIMDTMLNGHGYAKSAIDMACWDLLGHATGKPICELLGGRHGESFKLYRAITMASAEAMAANVDEYRKQGYTKFQLKVGGDPLEDIGDRLDGGRNIVIFPEGTRTAPGERRKYGLGGAVLAAMGFGLLLGMPILGIRGDYLAIATLGFGEIIRILLRNMTDLTGGPNGITASLDPTTGDVLWVSTKHHVTAG